MNNLWGFVAFLQDLIAKSVCLRFTLFCREICFGTIYALLCGEKFSRKLCPWRKNDKYEVCRHPPWWQADPPLLLGIHISLLRESDPEGIRISSWTRASSFRWLLQDLPRSFQTPSPPGTVIFLPVCDKDFVEESLLCKGDGCGRRNDKDGAGKA